MKSIQHEIQLATTHPLEIIDISGLVQSFCDEIKVRQGLLHIASRHTTLGVMLNEKCDALEQDMLDFLRALAPARHLYRHNQVAVDGRANAHSHMLAMVIPSQLSLIVADGRLNLGQWQSVFAVELDGPRPERVITLTLMGM